MLTKPLLSFFFLFVLITPVFAAVETFPVDTAHSSVGFSISHMMVSKVTGTFNEFDGVIKFDPQDLPNSSVQLNVKIDSIDTNNEARDTHLKKDDFFDAPKYPVMTFQSKKIVHDKDGEYRITGDLTMKGVTKEVEIPVTINGPFKDPMGEGQLMGIVADFTVNRSDFGVGATTPMAGGGLMLGNDVKASVYLEARKQ